MAKRQCDGCQMLMAPYLPRRRKDDQYLCPACYAKPRGGYVSASRDQNSCPHDGGWNLHGQCKQCGYTPSTEGDEPCDNPWCVQHEPEHTKAEHIDPPHLDPGHPDYHSAQQGVEDAIGEHPDAWLLDHNDQGPTKFSHKADDHEVLYHITDRHNFHPDAEQSPTDNAFALQDRSHYKGLYVTDDPDHWRANGYHRPYVAEIHVPHGVARQERWHGEKFIPAEHFDKIKVNRVMPFDQHQRERWGDKGTVEEYKRTPASTGDKDAREFTPEEHTEHLTRMRDYLHDVQGYGWNEFNDAHEHVGTDETDDEGMPVRRDRDGDVMTRGRYAKKAAGGLGDAMKGVIEHMTQEHGLAPEHMGAMMRETQGGTPPVPAAETPKWSEDPKGLTNHVNSMVAWHDAMHRLHKDVLHHGDYMQKPTDSIAYPHVHGPEDDLTHPTGGYGGFIDSDTGKKNVYDPNKPWRDNEPVIQGGVSRYHQKNEYERNRLSPHRTDDYPNLVGEERPEWGDALSDRAKCPTTHPLMTRGPDEKCPTCGVDKLWHAEYKPSEIGQNTPEENSRRIRDFNDRVRETAPIKPLPHSLNNKKTAADERDLWQSWEEGMSPKDNSEARGLKPKGINDCYVCNQPTSPHSFQKQDDGTYMCPRCSHAKNQHSEHDIGWHDYTPGPPPDDGYGRFEPNRNLFSLNNKTAHQQEIEMKYAPVARLIHSSGIQVVAHDSGDGETIYHCPFCGSGQVVARSDGTVECEFCHTSFTVQVQPEMSAFPQTINGIPVDVPGMPGEIGSEAPMNPADLDPGAETGAPGDGSFPPDADGGEAGDVEADNEEKDEDSGPPKFSSLKTDTGVELAIDEFVRHLAIKHAPDRRMVTEAIRTRRNRDQ